MRTPHPCPRASGHPALLHLTFRIGDADADAQPRIPHAADPFPSAGRRVTDPSGSGAPAAPRRADIGPRPINPNRPCLPVPRKPNFRCGTALATFSGISPQSASGTPPPETRINAEGGRATKSRPRAVSAEQVEGSATPAQTGRAETLAGAFHPNTRPLPAGTGRQFRRRDPSYSIQPGTVSRKAAPLSFPPADAGHSSGIAAGHAAQLNRHNARDSSAADLPDVHGPPTHRVR